MFDRNFKTQESLACNAVLVVVTRAEKERERRKVENKKLTEREGAERERERRQQRQPQIRHTGATRIRLSFPPFARRVRRTGWKKKDNQFPKDPANYGKAVRTTRVQWFQKFVTGIFWDTTGVVEASIDVGDETFQQQHCCTNRVWRERR